jgi:hypothetical protein
MKLTKKALEAIRPLEIRQKIALALKVSEQSIRRYIISNGDELTKAAAIQVIREETGLSDSEILENEKAIA